MRSTDPRDYQELPQRLAVMAKRFPDGFFIDPHQHLRDQLIYAVSGVMRIGTSEDSWVVPPDRAVLMPASVEHSIEICGDVEMRTLYIASSRSSEIKVLMVSPLLRELITALASEPMDFSGNCRAEKIAELITTELATAMALPLNIPLPRDIRLQKVCQQLLTDPSTVMSLEELSERTGASPKTITRLCKTDLGMTFSVWRRRVRFSKAFELLDSNHSIKEVASKCGYESPSAFAFAFKKEFGASPTDFREDWPSAVSAN